MNLPRTRFAHRHRRVSAGAGPHPRAHVPAVRRRVWAAAVLLALAALGLAACSGGAGGGAGAPTATTTAAADRPSSPAKLTIGAPRNGQTVKKGAELRLGLDNARIINQTTTRIQGDEGHIHLRVDGRLVDMNYGLRQRLPQLPAGQHVVQVEFVAADHAPFEPRILTQAAFAITG